MALAEVKGREPSALRERLPLAILAATGCTIATYLALYQLGSLRTVWEPFFGNGSERVLHSVVSRLLPVPDATLGAAGYAAELVGGAIGGPHRWRTMSRFVIGYGALTLFVALTALALAILQVFVIGAGCTLCLMSTAISLAIVALAWPEVSAAIQALKARRYEKR